LILVPIEILTVCALGGLLALDGTAVGQFMFSRPLVAGALTGWVLGDAALGLAVGTVLELYLLVSFPTGGARFPEGSTATVVAVAAAAPFSGPGAIPIAVAIGLVWGQIGGATISAQRHLNSRLVPEPGDPEGGLSLGGAHALAISTDFLRGALVTLAGVVLGRAALGLVVEQWPLSSSESTGLLLVGGAVSLGCLLHDLGGFRRRRVLFAAGLALGVVGTRFL